LYALNAYTDDKYPINVDEIASLAGDCEVVRINGLTEATAIDFLKIQYNVTTSYNVSQDRALAGALCVAEGGLLRWILVRADDPDQRQRFTIAHELGHLFVEVERQLTALSSNQQSTFLHVSESPTALKVFTRCDSGQVDPGTLPTEQIRIALSDGALNEIRAHHFAAELLMPYEDLKLVVQSHVGSVGVRTSQERDSLVQRIASRYDVSLTAARHRIEKDLGIIPLEHNPNIDLFM
jgi:Zn-dependent peptidase ImmA (M78 family)